jgi:chemotaxis protein methyltransferase CheR
MSIEALALAEIAGLIEARTGVECPISRREELALRADRIQAELGLRSAAALAGLLRAGNEAAWVAAIAQVTVGETYFFRDAPFWQCLERDILAPLIAARRAAGRRRLVFWSAGCSTGEEAYTLAILLGRMLDDAEEWDLRILATDVDERALAAARHGRYGPLALREVPEAPRRSCFTPRDGGFRIVPALRRRVAFRRLDLSSGGLDELALHGGTVDVALCRNVLMYLTAPARRHALRLLQRALAPEGWLLLAPAESAIGASSPLAPVRLPCGLGFRPAKAPAAPKPAAALRPMARPKPAPPRHPAPSAVLPPPTADHRTAEARGAADAGDLERAEALCRAALDLDSLHVPALLLLALVCQARDRSAEAITWCRAALFLDSGLVMARVLRGDLLLQARRPEEARRDMRIAADLLAGVEPDAAIPHGAGLTATTLSRRVAAQLRALPAGRG